MKYFKTTYSSVIGTITLASDGEHIVGLWNEKQKYHGDEMYKDMVIKDDLIIFDHVKKWLDQYFNGEKPRIEELDIVLNGTAFQKEVWDILISIPYGEVITYKDIAEKIAKKHNKKSMSAQAVGGAVGHNPISIIIPCHRVVGTNKSLTGYAGGIKSKIKLLELEGVDISLYTIPKKEMSF